MGKSTVAIVRAAPGSDYNTIRASVRRVIDLSGGLADLVRPGALVLIKPNVLAPSKPGDGALTDPLVCRAIADYVRELGGRAVIAEASAVGVDTEKAFESVGYDRLRTDGYEVIDLKKQPPARLRVDDPLVQEEFGTWQIVLDADLIVSVPVLKTHDQAEMTLSLKNLKGLECDRDKKELHRRGIFKGVADLASALKPGLTVIDGIVGQEGLGPLYGIPNPTGLLLASRDLVAADAVASTVAGFQPEELGTTTYAAQKGLGVMDLNEIEVVGETIASVRRRFLRCSEDERVTVEGFRILHAPGTCTGCRNTVLSAMFDMKNADQLGYLPGLTVITGPGVEIPEGVAGKHCRGRDLRAARPTGFALRSRLSAE